MKKLIPFLLIFSLNSLAGHFATVNDFGANPGALTMKKYIPDDVGKNAALVLLLHGCSQPEETYAVGSGWTKFADKYGFYLLTPAQNSNNNIMKCFNWFQPGDIVRGKGEAASIANMINQMKKDHSIDDKKVFVTGLSSGGAMTLVMLSTYPEIFNAGATVAGIPFGCARDMAGGFMCMRGQDKTPAVWGKFVKDANNYRGTFPRLSVWQGTADPHVGVLNASEIVEQWTNVHGMSTDADQVDHLNGHEHFIYKKNNRPMIEKVLVQGQSHGQPINPGTARDECGTPSQWILDSDICASYHIGKFWGITN